jgi:hypothetical protein
VGLGTSLALAIREAIDTSWEVDKYNENLYNSILPGKRPLGFNPDFALPFVSGHDTS